MARYLLATNPGECTDLNDFNRSVDLPIKRDCSPTKTDWILQDCENVWCESKKSSDPEFTMSYEDGDIIHFQFQFDDEYNEDPENPISGWGSFVTARMICSGGSIALNEWDDFATGMVGWNGTNSYQILAVDTSLITREECKCWSIEVKSWKTTDEGDVVSQTICTERFGLKRCDDLVKVEGIYSEFDCFGNWYGQPEPVYLGSLIQYSNALKWDGFLRDSGYTVKKELYINKTKTVTSRQIWTLTVRVPIPPFAKNTLYGQLLAGEKLLIDDEEYYIESVEAEKFGNMFRVQVEVWRECELNKTC